MLENILLRTNDGQSPTGIGQRLFHDKTVFTLEVVHHNPFLAGSNNSVLGTNEYKVGVGVSPFAGKNLREDAP